MVHSILTQKEKGQVKLGHITDNATVLNVINITLLCVRLKQIATRFKR